MHKTIWLACLCLFAAPCFADQQFDLPSAAAMDPTALAQAMPKLAQAVLTGYHEGDRQTYLSNLFRLQLVAGQYDEAIKTFGTLQALREDKTSPQSVATDVQYEIYAEAKADQGRESSSFDAAFQEAFRAEMSRLDDRSSALVMREFEVFQPALEADLDQALQQQKDKSSIGLTDALNLIRAYQVVTAYRAMRPLTTASIAEDDQRRYLIDKDVQVKTPDGATVCTLVVRPHAASGRLPTLLTFTIYANDLAYMDEARRSASNSYAAVVGYTRGKACSPGAVIPYEHDGADAAALIDWISRQPWSDGRVGMYGGSYNGFSQWAAAKHMPKALKALMPSVPVGPAIDVPMEGNVSENFLYPWPFYVTDTKTLDDVVYGDSRRWSKLNHDWYVSRRAYRELDKIDGTPNPIFRRWLDHPSYDAYWQSLIPYQDEFAKVNIPVLSTGGYYYGGPGALTYYFNQHYKYDPKAEHYLVIGPYDHLIGQYGTVARLGGRIRSLNGYTFDPVAQIDLGELRYQWFDYVFKGAPKPAILQDKVNYEVMGANVWKHAPSFAAMADASLRFHLTTAQAGSAYRLSEAAPTGGGSITQQVDLADRSDVDRVAPGGSIVDKQIDTWNGVEFVSAPFQKATEVSGLFSGHLAFITDKKDFDYNIQLYELTAQGEYVQLSYYMQRASYTADRSHRALLTPGQKMQLDFRSERLTSRLFQRGSRLVAVLSIVKEPDIQIDYGSGKDVSEETVADAQKPLTIQWLDESYLDIPVRR